MTPLPSNSVLNPRSQGTRRQYVLSLNRHPGGTVHSACTGEHALQQYNRRPQHSRRSSIWHVMSYGIRAHTTHSFTIMMQLIYMVLYTIRRSRFVRVPPLAVYTRCSSLNFQSPKGVRKSRVLDVEILEGDGQAANADEAALPNRIVSVNHVPQRLEMSGPKRCTYHCGVAAAHGAGAACAAAAHANNRDRRAVEANQASDIADEDRKSTRLNSSHSGESRMPSSA